MLSVRADPENAGHNPRLRPNSRVLLYCGDGSRSALAASSLHTLGYTNVGRMPSPY
jgi:rhodanese-related sulfurtransferase